jgi:hypothetical protein
MTRELPLTRTVGFEYVGETALTVLGPFTRTRYRFRSAGVRREVDHRDAPYVSGVPNLRRVPKGAPSEAHARSVISRLCKHFAETDILPSRGQGLKDKLFTATSSLHAGIHNPDGLCNS